MTSVGLLQEVLASVDDFAAAYVAWNAAIPGWTYGPELTCDQGQWVPTRASVGRSQVPLISEKPIHWTAAPLAGLASFRHAVQAEIKYIEHSHAQSSNAPYLCDFWHEVLHALAHSSPLLALNTTVTAHAHGPRVKVQIVSNLGQCWTRLVPLRLDALLHESRAVDAARDLDIVPSQDDFVTENTLIKIAEELAASSDGNIMVQMVLSRMNLEPERPAAPPVDSSDYWTAPESVRLQWRLAAIISRIESLGVHVRFGVARPLVQVNPFPRPPPPLTWHPTATLNLDVSALVALCSDITHGLFANVHGHANRALAEQAAQEEKHALLPFIAAQLHEPTQLVATDQVLEKFATIVATLASPSERARAQWLMGPRHKDLVPPWRQLAHWERLCPEPVRRVSYETVPVNEEPYADACLSALAQVRSCTRPKSLGQSSHTWHALQWGLRARTTTLLAHAHGVQELTEAAGPPIVPLHAEALLWLIQPRSFVSTSRQDEQGLGATRSRSDSSSSTTACLSDLPPPRPRSFRTLGRRVWDWLQGPMEPQKELTPLPRWWPLTPLETGWLRVTSRVAWSEPPPIALPGGPDDEYIYMEELASDTRDDASLERASKTNREWLPETVASRPPGSAWWCHLGRDVRHNALHWLLLCATCIAWLFAFAVLVDNAWFHPMVKTSNGWETPMSSSCTTTFWSRNAGCGLNGAACAPFSDTRYAFQCPSGCEKTTLLNPRQVGNQSYNYMPLIVGGNNGTYRGDSFLCAAAQHAGVIGRRGGCGLLRLVGTYDHYTPSLQHGLQSVPFESVFPQSFQFDTVLDQKNCTDERWKMYVLNAVLTAFVTLVLRPMPIFLFWLLSIVGFWHVNLVSELRDNPPPVGEAVGDFGAYLFVCFVIWYAAVRHIWPHFCHVPLQFGCTMLGLWWIGVLLDVVFADVPLQRLEARDIEQQPGALPSLIVIVLVVFVLAINQVRVVRNAGVLPKFITLYVVAAVILGLCAAVPGEGIRLHHYVISLALLPGCAFPTWISQFCAAFLFGMFINGIGRWGFDGLLQDEKTIQGDATGFSALPSFAMNTTAGNPVIRWNSIPPSLTGTWDSFALLVDDVLRYTGPQTSYNLTTLIDSYRQAPSDVMPWSKILHDLQTGVHYIRLAYSSGGSPGDFTQTALAWMNGTFVPPPPGRT